MFVRRSLISKTQTNINGFTLIELVIGITVMSIALMVMTGALFPQAERSTNPWFQVRSAELAQSMMNEILARRFDENSFSVGSLRCGETGGGDCLDEANLPNDCSAVNTWAEEGIDAIKSNFDDVDDFHCFKATGDEIRSLDNDQLNNAYASFTINVTVQYAGIDLGFLDNTATKLITVTVTPPTGDDVVYASYKANY